MSKLTITVLLMPFFWLALVFGVNRLMNPNRYPIGSRTVLALSVISPLLTLIAYGLSEVGPLETFHDPKFWAIAVTIGAPASLIAAAFALWGRWLALRKLRRV